MAVLLLTGLSCKCALSWLLLHYLFFSAWPVTHLSYPAGRQPSGVLLGLCVAYGRARPTGQWSGQCADSWAWRCFCTPSGTSTLY